MDSAYEAGQNNLEGTIQYLYMPMVYKTCYSKEKFEHAA